MRKIVLAGVLFFASTVLADAGVVSDEVVAAMDAGVAAPPAVVEVVDAGATLAADAGTSLVDGDSVDLAGMLRTMQESGHGKNWNILFGIAGVLVVLTWALRKVGGAFLPVLKTDRGGAVLVLVLGVAGGVVNALAVGSGVTLDVVVAGMGVGFLSAGGFNVLKKVIFPSDTETPSKPS